jgi:hypothetical protein
MTASDKTDDAPAITPDDMALASIVHSNTQMDYVAQVFREEERENPPTKADYEFGQPVYALQSVRGTSYAVVGVVYDTRLVDPDQGSNVPRLSAPDQEMFVPGYVNEKQTLLGIALLGSASLPADSVDASVDDPYTFVEVSQTMPQWTLDVDDFVYRLPDEGFRQFHVRDSALVLEYYERLISTAGQFGPEVVLALLDRLRSVTEADEAVLDVIEKKVRWQSSSDRGVVR